MKTFIAFLITVVAFVVVILMAKHAPVLLGSLSFLMAFVLFWAVVSDLLN